MRRMLTKGEVQEIAGEGQLNPDVLLENLEGSDTVVVDLNEAGTKVAVKLDQDVIDEIDSKQSALTAGEGISIIDNVISVSFEEAESEEF